MGITIPNPPNDLWCRSVTLLDSKVVVSVHHLICVASCFECVENNLALKHIRT